MSFSKQDMTDDAEWEACYRAVQAESDAILASEGANTVRGLHYDSTEDAAQARMQVAVSRVKAKAREEAEVRAMKLRSQTHLRELFQASPFCVVCNERILEIGQATVFTPIGGKDRIVHGEKCLEEMIRIAVGRYMGRGRGGVIRQAAS